MSQQLFTPTAHPDYLAMLAADTRDMLVPGPCVTCPNFRARVRQCRVLRVLRHDCFVLAQDRRNRERGIK